MQIPGPRGPPMPPHHQQAYRVPHPGHMGGPGPRPNGPMLKQPLVTKRPLSSTGDLTYENHQPIITRYFLLIISAINLASKVP